TCVSSVDSPDDRLACDRTPARTYTLDLGKAIVVDRSAKERNMASKRGARREFLKSGAALAGGFTLGAVAPAIGQTHASPPMKKGDRDQIAYGDRSRFVTSVRIAHPVGGRPSPDAFGL